MARDLHQFATLAWKKIKHNLEDRSVLHLDNLDSDLLQEVEDEQIKVIFDAMIPLDTVRM